MEFQPVKQEIVGEDTPPPVVKERFSAAAAEEAAIAGDLIELSDSSDEEDAATPAMKKLKVNGALPSEFTEPIPALPDSVLLLPPPPETATATASGCKQFWKAGDYEGSQCGGLDHNTGGMDHVRVHPKFLHSNATSHKWALGAFAELLDNSLDEVCYGATFVNVDMLINKKDGNKMLLVEDNGGGMDPEKMRQCMSLGYSVKSKLANTIGQYGNGFKTSTMRLGADVIVFSRCRGTNGRSATQSIGLLSYTFLRSTGKEDIVVPILDYENRNKEWWKIVRSSDDDWKRNVETIVNWSPYSSEAELLQQFNLMKGHGTRVVIYNLWEDDQGQLELDFNSDRHDIQIRGVNRDEKNVQMAAEYPNSKHFLTYRHSLRSYVSILYLRLPPGFRIILRGKDVEHHNIVNDMMMAEEVTYRPQPTADGALRDTNMVAVVTIGFVKDARAHIDVQGFNVYHKNRLIKPFWRVWNAAGSDGRGVIGVLEANFVEPAHDKQGFERTTVLARLENKLVQMQKTYWSSQCHKIGYAPRRNKKQAELDRESSPECAPSSSRAKPKRNIMNSGMSSSSASQKRGKMSAGKYASVNEKCGNGRSYHARQGTSSEEPSSPSSEDANYSNEHYRVLHRRANGNRNTNLTSKTSGKTGSEAVHPAPKASAGTRQVQTPCPIQKAIHVQEDRPVEETQPVQEGTHVQEPPEETQQDLSIEGVVESLAHSDMQVLDHLKEENRQLKERLAMQEVQILSNLQQELQLERDKCESLKTQLQEAEARIEELNKEQESLIDIFSEERDRRDIEEENLRKRLREASSVMEELRERVRLLESKKYPNGGR